MNTKVRLSAKICLALVIGVLAAAPVNAADKEERPEQRTKEAQAVSKAVYDEITKAQEAVDLKDYAGALKTLNRLYNPDKLTEYEQSNVLNYLGFVYYNMDDINNAIRIYEMMIAIPSLEEQMRKGTLYTLAQLQTMQEQYNKALVTLDKWFVIETNPPPEPFILKAQNLYQVKRYAAMIEPIENAIRVANSRRLTLKEDWYVLLNFAYFQQEDYAKVRDIQKILLLSWPKKNYWFSLAGAYTELGEDENLVNAYEAAHTQAMLEKEGELVTMAQLYMQREIPFKAAQLLDREMASGRVGKNAKNYRLLSQAWVLAQEDERALPALKEAARLTSDGDLDIRLGNTLLNTGDYAGCVSAVSAGIRKGGLKSPDNAQISLGMCLYNQRRYTDAIRAFEQAAKTRRSRKTSSQWTNVIRQEIERNRQIDEAEKSANKRLKDVADRKAASSRI